MLLPFFALFVVQLQAVLVPGPPGPYSVSYQVHDLTDHSRWDPYALSSSPHKRRIMVSSYIPVQAHAKCRSQQLPYMPPNTTTEYGLYAGANGLPTDIFEDIQIQFCQLPRDPKDKHKRYPLVLFSPGLSSSRLLHSAQARALASFGFLVMTIDHPYDATFVEFPDGAAIRSTIPPIPSDAESDDATKVRAADISFVLDLFYRSAPGATLPKMFKETADLKRVFAYGHSLGGAAAAEVSLLDHRIQGGVDLDGSPWAKSAREGLDEPFVMAGKSTDNGIDPTWEPFYEKLRGPKMQLRVEGATHYSFIDIPLLLVARPLPEKYDPLIKQLVGTVEGSQMQAIIMGLLDGFAALVLDENTAKLRALNTTFPEILVVEEDLSI